MAEPARVLVHSNLRKDHDICPSCWVRLSEEERGQNFRSHVPLTSWFQRGVVVSSLYCDLCQSKVASKEQIAAARNLSFSDDSSSGEDESGEDESDSSSSGSDGSGKPREPHIIFSAHGDTCFDDSFCSIVPNSNGGLFFGHMDNFAGVNGMLSAYFSGMMPRSRVQCKITWGEEDENSDGEDFLGARELMECLQPSDFVVVVDVTGVCSREVLQETVVNANSVMGHVVIEKVKRKAEVIEFLIKALGNPIRVDGVATEAMEDLEVATAEQRRLPRYTYEYWNECNDPQADEDETDAYRTTQKFVIFLGLPTCGGEYVSPDGGHALQSNGDYNDGPVFCWKKDIDAASLAMIDLSRCFEANPLL